MKNKIWSSIVTILLSVGLIAGLFLLSGCVESKIKLGINKDGSADLVLRVTVDSSLTGYISEDIDPLEDLMKEAAAAGFNVAKVEEDGQEGFEASRKIQDLKSSLELGKLFGMDSLDDGFTSGDGFVIDRGVFKTTYRVDIAYSSAPGGDYGVDYGGLLDSIQSEFELTLPVAASSHNADSVSADGRTLTWDLISDGTVSIQARAEVINYSNMVILAVVALLVGGTAAIYIVRGVRRRKAAAENQPEQ